MSAPKHTTEILAEALEAAGLPKMAKRAQRGEFHDYLSPHATPCLLLHSELTKIGTPAALAIRARHENGDFDANEAEADEWARGPEGQAAFASLIQSGKPESP